MQRISERPTSLSGGSQQHSRAVAMAHNLSDREFESFRKLIYESAGIQLSSAKKALVAGRLAKRLKALGFANYGEYFELIDKARDSNALLERQTAINLLTTNETYFFREPKHFDFIRETVLPEWKVGKKRLWSAASSSGEEAYTLAMLMRLYSGNPLWEIVGTDINTDIVDIARRGQYPIERSKNIPAEYLHRCCLKGVGRQSGTFIIERKLRERVRFCSANLRENLQSQGLFDLVMLRNVMIYFDLETKRQVVANVLRQLKPGGWLIIGHSESLNGVSTDVEQVRPTIYQKPNLANGDL